MHDIAERGIWPGIDSVTGHCIKTFKSTRMCTLCLERIIFLVSGSLITARKNLINPLTVFQKKFRYLILLILLYTFRYLPIGRFVVCISYFDRLHWFMNRNVLKNDDHLSWNGVWEFSYYPSLSIDTHYPLPNVIFTYLN